MKEVPLPLWGRCRKFAESGDVLVVSPRRQSFGSGLGPACLVVTHLSSQRCHFYCGLRLPPSEKKNLYYKDTPGEILRELWRRYIEAIEPLRKAGKLGAVHFQFAPWVVNNADGRTHVEHCADVMDGYTLAAEFRHKSWFSDKARETTLSMEREFGLVNVVVDEPNTTANSIPAIWEVTNPQLALVRLHGRNHETWNIQGAASASSRFNYDYNEQELGELAGSILKIAKSVERTHVVFNNNFEDQGQRNARTLMGILGAAAVLP